MKMDERKVGSDRADGINWIREMFNSYVNPEVHPEYWDQRSITVHGILPPDDERIMNAGNMRILWPEFQCWFHSIERSRDTISAPRAQADYVANYNAVDRNDWDSADYSTTIRTNRYYLRIFCWALDVIHAA
jgi:hypothetical protein